MFHELCAMTAYHETGEELSYWRLPSGIEVNFIVGDMRVAIEAKATTTVTARHLRGLRTLAEEHPELAARVVVCLEDRPRRTHDGIDIIPADHFARRLWQEGLAP